MISYKEHILNNGLKIIVHEDPSTPMSVVNLLYKVGARDEEENKTGFAHLFEHLMFGGSLNAPSFDQVLERAGGENNAFTNNDLTNYYDIIPAVNIETALWLESDRMRSLSINEKSLKTQKKVVIEEFKENYLNQPYGDVWHLIREMVYTIHPYKWPTIGKNISHIEIAELSDVVDFFDKFYRPNNAILSVAGGIEADHIIKLVEKHFSNIPQSNDWERKLPVEPEPNSAKFLKVERDVPADLIYKVYLMSDRIHRDYYVYDLITDILSSGKSTRLYKKLVKEKELFTTIDAYITGNIDKGLLIVTGRLAPDANIEEADKAIEDELHAMASKRIHDQELQKFRNKIEASHEFNEIHLMNRAFNLAYCSAIDDIDLVNREKGIYLSISSDDIIEKSQQLFDPNKCATLYYMSKNGKKK